tara:strand:- start:849 stop:1655 length:807 start_codon:yes stop_codon:yes gene_type:complete
MTISIRDYVEDLELSDGETTRSDCPVCGRNTFTATNESGIIKYNCFRVGVGCDLKPSFVSVNLSAEEISNRLSDLKETKKVETPTFNIPEYITYPEPSQTTYHRFISRWGLENEYLDVMYDVKDDRAVFLIRDRHKVIDAIGRALGGAVPKWYRYTGNATVFSRCLGESNGVVVIVEDVISAITVAKVCPNVTGIAVLGTNINYDHMKYLQDYTKIIVALDPDATHKSIEYKREIESWTGINTMVMMLQDDIKYKTEEDVLKLKEYTQ